MNPQIDNGKQRNLTTSMLLMLLIIFHHHDIFHELWRQPNKKSKTIVKTTEISNKEIKDEDNLMTKLLQNNVELDISLLYYFPYKSFR